jgi:hypothetical protein
MINKLWRAIKAIFKEEYSCKPVVSAPTIRPGIAKLKELQKTWHDLQDIAPLGSDLEMFKRRNKAESFIDNILFAAVTRFSYADDKGAEEVLVAAEVCMQEYIEDYIVGITSFDPAI